MPRIPESLRALLTNLIDYAGLYPPADLALPVVLENYARYLESPESWMLNRLVLSASKLAAAPLRPDWHVTLLVENEPGPLPVQFETIETKSAACFSLPTYCEVPLDRVPPGAFAKIRTGGLTPEAIPSCEAIAQFLVEAAARRIPFKATAGLHHPIRSQHPLTYAAESPRATMHGFINVFAAAAYAWKGSDYGTIVAILSEEDAGAFHFFPVEMQWRDLSVTASEIESARRDFAHSFGSCSFTEPIADLRDLGYST